MSDTIISMFNERVSAQGSKPALRTAKPDGSWRIQTWSEYGRDVRAMARALADLGVGEGDAVALMSSNRPEYFVADLAVVACGGVAVPVYRSNSPEQIAYVLEHSFAKAIFVEDDELAAKVAKIRDDMPSLSNVITFTTGMADATYSELLEKGLDLDADDPGVYDDLCADVAPDDLAVVIYTSGTTGPPKGAMLTQGNLVWTVKSLTQVMDVENYRVVSYLPLAHIAERMLSHYLVIHFGGEAWFGGGIDTLKDDIAACRPTLFFGVPRVFEKFETAIRARIDGLDGIQGELARSAQKVGENIARARQAGKTPRLMDSLFGPLLDKLVMAKLRSQLGFDCVEVVVSGAAPITQDTLYYFASLGLPVCEVYGQTEDCGPTSLNPPSRIKIGTVGPPLPGVDVRIADDGEILVRGGNVFKGYFHDDAATTATLRDGWLYSGDLGEIDDDGYLRITGRKKDLIITAGGKNISPQNIESELRRHSLIGYVVAIGDRRKFVSALITIDAEAIAAWALERGLAPEGIDVASDETIRTEIERAVAEANEKLSQAERVKKFSILERDFDEDTGELTPTLKVKRNIVVDKYGDVIDAMYGPVTK